MKPDDLPDWIAAVASVIAAIAAVIGVWLTVRAAAAAKRSQNEARLRFATKMSLRNVWRLDVSWLPDSLNEGLSLTAEILKPETLEFGDRAPEIPYDPDKPWRGHDQPEELINRSRLKSVPLRQGRGSADGLAASLWIWAPPGSGESARVRVTIRADASRRVLARKTIAISPIN